jgi:hypothetical protein
LRQERLYFFQFPSPFPTFVSKSLEPSDDPGETSHVSEPQVKRVSFSADTKPPASVPEDVDKDQLPPHVDGVIGQLEVYKSGAVKMRLANGILLDVSFSLLPNEVSTELRRRLLPQRSRRSCNKPFTSTARAKVCVCSVKLVDALLSLPISILS